MGGRTHVQKSIWRRPALRPFESGKCCQRRGEASVSTGGTGACRLQCRHRIAGGQAGRFTVSCRMLKPIYLLITGLLAAGPLLAQTEPNKSPAKDAEKPPTVKEPAKKPAEQSPPPAAGQSPATAPNASTDVAAKPQVDKNPPPLDPKNMDTSVKPSDDFYLFANGGWVKSNPVPPEFSRWASFNELAEKNNDALHEIAEKAAGGATDDPKKSKANDKANSADVKKVGDFYASGMNE